MINQKEIHWGVSSRGGSFYIRAKFSLPNVARHYYLGSCIQFGCIYLLSKT